MRNWQRQVSGNPGEQSPVAKHPEGVHRGGQGSHAKNSFAEEQVEESRSTDLGAVFPHGRLGNIAADPEHQQRWENSDEKYRTPAKMRQYHGDYQRRDGFTNGVGGLHQPQGFATMFGSPRFGYQRSGGGPFAAHPKT